MAAAVNFDFNGWVARYPEFASVPADTAQLYWNDATILWNNRGCSPASQTTTQQQLLNMLTAHIASIYWKTPAQGGPGPADPNAPVGRIASATEGSVTVSTDIGLTPTASIFKAWLQQSKYGFQFLASITQYVGMHYVPGRLQPGGAGYLNGAPPYWMGGWSRRW